MTIQQQIDQFAQTTGTLFASSEVISEPIRMRPGVDVIGGPGVVISQGNGCNLPCLFDFDYYSASSSAIRECTLNGNWENNVHSVQYALIKCSQPDVEIYRNRLINAPGCGIKGTCGAGSRIYKNDFDFIRETAVLIASLTIRNISDTRVYDNDFSNIGLHAVGTIWCDYVEIVGNRVKGTCVNNHVTTQGTQVTWESGPDFSLLSPGMIMRIVGVEYQIQLKTSTTSLVLTSSAGNHTNVVCTSGTGDLINIDSSSITSTRGNIIDGGMSGGIVVHNSEGSENAVGNVVNANTVGGIGGSGISVQSLGPASTIDTTNITANLIIDCGQGGLANPAWGNSGIVISGANTNGVLVDGNQCRGFGTQTYGAYVSGDVSKQSVLFGTNFMVGNSLGAIHY